MENKKEYKHIIYISFAALFILFYWFQLRPSTIRKECYLLSIPTSSGLTNEEFVKLVEEGKMTEDGEDLRPPKISLANDKKYKNCLRKNGINED